MGRCANIPSGMSHCRFGDIEGAARCDRPIAPDKGQLLDKAGGNPIQVPDHQA